MKMWDKMSERQVKSKLVLLPSSNNAVQSANYEKCTKNT